MKEYKQTHSTIEPAPLRIEPNMIFIQTQQKVCPRAKCDTILSPGGMVKAFCGIPTIYALLINYQYYALFS